MPKLTPIQNSFSAGEISPLMYQRSDTKGYKEGLMDLTNMFPDSRGPVYSRGGLRHLNDSLGNDARILALPVNDQFFYSAFFTDLKLTIGSMVGHNPVVNYTPNANFNNGELHWTVGTDGNAQSQVNFISGLVELETSANNNRYAYITQEITVPSAGNYRLFWNMVTEDGATFKIGTSADDGSIYDSGLTTIGNGNIVFTAPGTTVWMTMRVDGSNTIAAYARSTYFGIVDEFPETVNFVTPYEEADLHGLKGVMSPAGSALYIVHEKYPPYKLVYDRETDTFSWGVVEFVNDADPPVAAQPPEWVEGSYPSCGDFFEGRLWLGGTVNEPQTFWASKSGLPETFVTTGDGTLADDPLEFTMAKYGRIEWMVGFKNLVIGTQNAEHIVTSVGGFIKSDDIQVEQQSSYGSANVQPVQVGDQIFYVSSDRRKLRAIQYEWQKNNWLSKDLTFNSEHLTEVGIRHMTWQQNPGNLFHCILEDGTVASLTYERAQDIYGWSKSELGGEGKVLDGCVGPIQGTDYFNSINQYTIDHIAFESQSHSETKENMDSWVEREVEADGVTVTGLDHLEGFTVQVLVEGATSPDAVVVGGEITLPESSSTLNGEATIGTPGQQAAGDRVVVGLQFTPSLETLPENMKMQAGGSESYIKRWNKVYVRVLDSAMPLINGERSPERFPVSPMNETQPNVNEEILKVNLGFSRNQTITIEQDLPKSLVVLGVFGEMAQSIT